MERERKNERAREKKLDELDSLTTMFSTFFLFFALASFISLNLISLFLFPKENSNFFPSLLFFSLFQGEITSRFYNLTHQNRENECSFGNKQTHEATRQGENKKGKKFQFRFFSIANKGPLCLSLCRFDSNAPCLSPLLFVRFVPRLNSRGIYISRRCQT